MKQYLERIKRDQWMVPGFLLTIILYWFILFIKPPFQILHYFREFSFGLFIFVLTAFFLTYKLSGRIGLLLGVGLTFILFALTLAYKWETGYSDNFLIGGLIPYKDAKNYYYGAGLILNGFPLEKAGQATERPLFPGILSTLLLFTGQNLKISLAILVQLAGIGLYYSSYRVLRVFGPLSASLFSTLLFFYIQPWVGYTMSEIFGFCMGCFAFSHFWFVSKSRRWTELAIGIIVLIIAVSARAGAFLIFPSLIIWTGLLFRGGKHFSFKASIAMTLMIITAYFSVNILYARLIGIPPGSSFGNFAYALYGQVRGGTGWHTAIEELGTRNPALVYKAAFDFFREHPFSLLIGFVKAYRDFFLPGYPNIFQFDVYGQPIWLAYALWVVMMVALLLGLIHILKNIRSEINSLILAGFIGMILSVPFLPPIDGGPRFYAGTVPFFFVLPAIGLSSPVKFKDDMPMGDSPMSLFRYFSVALIALTVIMPIIVYSSNDNSHGKQVTCPESQEAFIVNVNPGSYLDITQDVNSVCGSVPDICLIDLKNNNSEFKIDDFYQEVYSMVNAVGQKVRLVPAMNLLDRRFHYIFIDSTKTLGSSGTTVISGCASEVRTQNQSILVIESLSP